MTDMIPYERIPSKIRVHPTDRNAYTELGNSLLGITELAGFGLLGIGSAILGVGSAAVGFATDSFKLTSLESTMEPGEVREVETEKGVWYVHSPQTWPKADLGFMARYHRRSKKGTIAQMPSTVISGPTSNQGTIDKTLETVTDGVLEPGYESVTDVVRNWPINLLNEEQGSIHGKVRGITVSIAAGALALTDILLTHYTSIPGPISSFNETIRPHVGFDMLAVYAAEVGAYLMGAGFTIDQMKKRSEKRGLQRDVEIAESLPTEARSFHYGTDAVEHVIGEKIRAAQTVVDTSLKTGGTIVKGGLRLLGTTFRLGYRGVNSIARKKGSLPESE